MPDPTPQPIPPLGPRDIKRFWSKVDKTLGQGPQGKCWTWTGAPQSGGYGRLRIGNKTYRAHRVAYVIQYHSQPIDLVTHNCDNPPCIRGDHLIDQNVQGNVNDRVNRGRGATGERHRAQVHPESYARKLTPVQVLLVDKLLKQGFNWYQLAKQFNVHWTSIRAIDRRLSWKYLFQDT